MVNRAILVHMRMPAQRLGGEHERVLFARQGGGLGHGKRGGWHEDAKRAAASASAVFDLMGLRRAANIARQLECHAMRPNCRAVTKDKGGKALQLSLLLFHRAGTR